MSADAPLSVEVTPDALVVQWADGRTAVAATLLRAHCRCAPCQSARLRGEAIVGDGAVLVDALPVGHYALQLRFADGHERGIYPWQTLRALGLGD